MNIEDEKRCLLFKTMGFKASDMGTDFNIKYNN